MPRLAGRRPGYDGTSGAYAAFGRKTSRAPRLRADISHVIYSLRYE